MARLARQTIVCQTIVRQTIVHRTIVRQTSVRRTVARQTSVRRTIVRCSARWCPLWRGSGVAQAWLSWSGR